MKVKVTKIEELKVGDVFPSGMRVGSTHVPCVALESDTHVYNASQTDLDAMGGVTVERPDPKLEPYETYAKISYVGESIYLSCPYPMGTEVTVIPKGWKPPLPWTLKHLVEPHRVCEIDVVETLRKHFDCSGVK